MNLRTKLETYITGKITTELVGSAYAGAWNVYPSASVSERALPCVVVSCQGSGPSVRGFTMQEYSVEIIVQSGGDVGAEQHGDIAGLVENVLGTLDGAAPVAQDSDLDLTLYALRPAAQGFSTDSDRIVTTMNYEATCDNSPAA